MNVSHLSVSLVSDPGDLDLFPPHFTLKMSSYVFMVLKRLFQQPHLNNIFIIFLILIIEDSR